MDNLPPLTTSPIEINTPKADFWSVLTILFIIMLIILAFLLGILFQLKRSPITKNTISNIPTSTNLSPTLDIKSSIVSKAQTFYLIQGVIGTLRPISDPLTKERQTEIILKGPQGQIISQTFAIPNTFKSIVRLENNKEIPITLDQIKVNSFVYIDYVYDLKNPTESRVSRILKLSN